MENIVKESINTNTNIQHVLIKFKKIIRCLFMIFFPWVFIWRYEKKLKKYEKQPTLQSMPQVSPEFISQNPQVQEQDPPKLQLATIAGMLNWPEINEEVARNNGFQELLRLITMVNDSIVSNPSSCWNLLSIKNYDQLINHGYNNFKRTIGTNYFNFLVQTGDKQITAVENLLDTFTIEQCKIKTYNLVPDPNFNIQDQFTYYYFIFLLWEYLKKIDKHNYLSQLEEPSEGNPITIQIENKKFSQDLANSLIEYYSIDNAINFEKNKTILEIGGGYGRNIYIALKLNPKLKVVMVDILPALYIAQRYLTSIFKDRIIFKCQHFNNFSEIKNNFKQASIVFLMPHQLKLLPSKLFDLTINISSFGEMTVEQISWYYSEIDRLTKQYFYTKQWNESKNPFDQLILHKKDYPTPPNWQELYSRACDIQVDFLETLYRVT